ncbi:helix-turn-helix domain-containing protein [Xanthomonas citri]|uniref:helix-turn-helix domain-containing protein n=2 Tax=Xanthomonas citri TaxID=346 RepID=UPI00103A20F0|nr:helix-turn-helix transcriptional regulator [Xanthomonas citri pv. fuscans]
MVSSLVRSVMAAKGLSQREMADLLGVSLDRIKSLTSGRVKKLAPPEARALVEKLHVRGDYIATGQGALFQSEGALQLEQRLGALKETSAATQEIELPGRERTFVRDLLYGMAIRDSSLLSTTIENYVAERRAEYVVQPQRRKRGAADTKSKKT